jgi:hypothetical protein
LSGVSGKLARSRDQEPGHRKHTPNKFKRDALAGSRDFNRKGSCFVSFIHR